MDRIGQLFGAEREKINVIFLNLYASYYRVEVATPISFKSIVIVIIFCFLSCSSAHIWNHSIRNIFKIERDTVDCHRDII